MYISNMGIQNLTIVMIENYNYLIQVHEQYIIFSNKKI